MIEVGEYCRTREGFIAKLEKMEDSDTSPYGDERISLWHEDYYGGYEEPHIIVKHSKNIIDLIEVRRLCEWRKSK